MVIMLLPLFVQPDSLAYVDIFSALNYGDFTSRP